MIDGFSVGGFGPHTSGRGSAGMSEAQFVGLETVLSHYDPKDLSKSDAKEIVQHVKDLEHRDFM